jgi:hypothetical protein
MTFETFILSVFGLLFSFIVLIEKIKWQALEARVDASEALINWKEANPSSAPGDYSYSRELVMNLLNAYLYYIFWNQKEDGFEHALYILSLLETTNDPSPPRKRKGHHQPKPRLTAGISFPKY